MLRIFYPGFIRGRGAVGLLILRLVVGAAFVLHGWYKITSPGGMTAWMPPQFPVPGFLQAVAALSEFLGGGALLLGLLTPLATVFLAATMIAAIGMAHLPHGDPFVSPDPTKPGFELAAGYLAAALTVLQAGPGKLSADYCLFGRCGVARQEVRSTSPVHQEAFRSGKRGNDDADSSGGRARPL
jgi:putative oxidoreductase